MKTNLFLTAFFAFIISSALCAQIDIMQKVKDKVEQRADQKTDEAIDKGLDEVEEGVEESVSEDDEENAEEAESEEDAEPAKKSKKAKVESDDAEETAKAPVKSSLKSYSKYDFIPGDETLLYEDFTQDAVGDFPAKWNTNGSGEVVTLDQYPGNWLMFMAGTTYTLDFDPLPENFTIEFDFIQQNNEGNTGDFALKIISCEADERIDAIVPGYGGAAFRYYKDRILAWNWEEGHFKNVDSDLDKNILERNEGNIIRAKVWVQKERIRLYVNEEKIYDLPKCMIKGLKVNRLAFESNIAEGEEEMYLSNLRLASGAPDMRSKLLTEGKLVTRGILFDSGSDKIKPESYPTLKSIADVLKQNGDVRVKIIGHTDSDGQDAVNMELSKKRSASVKNSLINEFSIDASRLETDGKGETEPVSGNNTPEGKSNNRRVEFIKL